MCKFKVKTKNFKLFVLSFGIAYCVLCIAYCQAFAQAIPSNELINNAKQYDGKAVVYTGEVIGEIMVRGKFSWINVNDGEAAIGIWIDSNLAKEINYTGSYKTKGDWVEIAGIFQRACPAHGGDLDIHAQSIRKISSGRQDIEKLNLSKRNQTIILLGILCLIWILTRLKHK
jgi:hypothetical protein